MSKKQQNSGGCGGFIFLILIVVGIWYLVTRSTAPEDNIEREVLSSCEENDVSSDSYTWNDDVFVSFEGNGDDTSWSSSENLSVNDDDDVSGGQTAPVPDVSVSEYDIIGCWSPDIDAEEPHYIEFYFGEGGQLYYEYYRMCLGNSIGLNIANETTKWQYNTGLVEFYGSRGSCECLSSSGSGYVAISFYLSDAGQGVLYDQEDGRPFYRVG